MVKQTAVAHKQATKIADKNSTDYSYELLGAPPQAPCPTLLISYTANDKNAKDWS